MANEELFDLLRKVFQKNLSNDPFTAAFRARVRKGVASYADVLKYAERAGIHLTDVLKAQITSSYPNGIPPDVLEPMFREECKIVLDKANQVQRIVNRKAGINMQPVDVPIDEDRIRGLVEHIKESGVLDETKNLLTNLAESHVDDAIKDNAGFQLDSGMEVTVTRRYDDVGVNHGKDECQWCLDRCGENVPYKEALAMGMFQRHPGCGCIIEYNTSKGTKVQADWTSNSWKDSDSTLAKRRTIGL